MDQKAQERSDATALIQGPNLPSEAGKQRQHGAVSLAGPEHCEHEVSDGLPEDVDGMQDDSGRMAWHYSDTNLVCKRSN